VELGLKIPVQYFWEMVFLDMCLCTKAWIDAAGVCDNMAKHDSASRKASFLSFFSGAG